jgi:hypothetical protein
LEAGKGVLQLQEGVVAAAQVVWKMRELQIWRNCDQSKSMRTRMASAKEEAPVGMIMNSWKARALPACTPPAGWRVEQRSTCSARGNVVKEK